MIRNYRQVTNRRRPRQETSLHQFAVGQVVRMRNGLPLSSVKTGDTYEILATLPPLDNSPQYRIRNDEERHERVTTEDKIELVGASPLDESAALKERTFGHGQRTDAEQPRS